MKARSTVVITFVASVLLFIITSSLLYNSMSTVIKLSHDNGRYDCNLDVSHYRLNDKSTRVEYYNGRIYNITEGDYE